MLLPAGLVLGRRSQAWCTFLSCFQVRPARPHWLLAVPVPLQHVGATYVFIHPLKMGYVGAAWSTTW